jgi:hypothetical protein
MTRTDREEPMRSEIRHEWTQANWVSVFSVTATLDRVRRYAHVSNEEVRIAVQRMTDRASISD